MNNNTLVLLDYRDLPGYLAEMDLSLSEKTIGCIIELLNLNSDRFRRARVLLKVIEQCNTEQEVIEELGLNSLPKERVVEYPLRPEYGGEHSPEIVEMVHRGLLENRRSENQQRLVSELRFLEIDDDSFYEILHWMHSDERALEYLEWLKDNKYSTTQVLMVSKALEIERDHWCNECS